MTWNFIFHQNISWDDLEAKQQELIQQVQSHKNEAYLLISEPSPTFTYGRNSNPQELLWSKSELKNKQVQVASVTRGGKWTYHGPGQILIYPILHLPSWGYSSKSVRAFLEDFRTAIREALEKLGCKNLQPQEPFGLYIDNKKLVSFGLAFERTISSHGMALYYSDQSQFFSGITPCGVTHGSTTDLKEKLPQETSWNSVANIVAEAIKNSLSLRLTQVL